MSYFVPSYLWGDMLMYTCYEEIVYIFNATVALGIIWQTIYLHEQFFLKFSPVAR